jgi:hypothetical protein
MLLQIMCAWAVDEARHESEARAVNRSHGSDIRRAIALSEIFIILPPTIRTFVAWESVFVPFNTRTFLNKTAFGAVCGLADMARSKIETKARLRIRKDEIDEGCFCNKD